MELFPEEQETLPVLQRNEGQESAFQILVDFIVNPNNRWRKALLEGFAGTGKSTIINMLVEHVKLTNPDIAFGMTAPTHKAVGVLRKGSRLKNQLDFGTIHSFLGLKEKQIPNPKNKSEYIVVYEPDYESKYQKKVDGIDVLLIDESSMLGDDLYGHIDTAVKQRNIKVIFLGDGLQIPPVGKKQATGDSSSIPFLAEEREKRGILHVVLTEVVRQAKDNPIIGYATAIREQYLRQSITFPFPEDKSGIELVPKTLDALRPIFMQYFATPEFIADADHVKVIAWRNATVDYFNTEIRLLINNAKTLLRIIKGEKLVLDEPIVKGETIVLAKNENLETLEVQVGTHKLKYFIIDRNAFNAAKDEGDTGKRHYEIELKVYQCTVRTDDKKLFPVIILHEDSEIEYKKVVEDIKSSAIKALGFDKSDMWKQFYRIGKPFAWVKYNYCLTAHKSQGSTYDYCISMEWDIDQNRDLEERNRIRYVAATRARTKLFIVK